MAIPQRLALPGTYFVIAGHLAPPPLLSAHRHRRAIPRHTPALPSHGFYRLHAYVVMPDHIHLLLTPQAITLERAMMLMEGGFSHRLASDFPVW